MSAATENKSRIYYGWVVVILSFVMLTVVFIVQYSFGIFFKPLQDAFGWSRATTSWAMTAHLIMYGLSMVPVGWALDRFNPRIIFSIASVLIGSSLVLSSRITEAWQLYLLYGLPMGMGIGICGPPVLATVTRWFDRKRGLALGVSSAGVGFGTLIGAPLCEFLISSYGWREAFVILGIASCFSILVCAYFFKRPGKQAIQSRSEARENAVKGGRGVPAIADGLTFRQALKTREMFLMLATQAFTNFALRMVMVHIAPNALDKGISPSVAALAVGTIGGVSIVGRLAMGLVQDRTGAQRAMLTCLSIQATSMLLLPLVGADAALFAFAVAFGFTYGGDVPQVPVLVGQSCGLASIGVTYGLVLTAGNLGGALGPIVAGYAFDSTGSYTGVFLVAAAGLYLSIFCISTLRLRYGLHQPQAVIDN